MDPGEGIEKTTSLVCHLLVMPVSDLLKSGEDGFSDYSGSDAVI